MNHAGLLRSGSLQILVLVAAGLLAWPARAQSISSANTLGYVDATFLAGSNLIANPLFASDNTVSNLFRGVPDGTVFLPWNQGNLDFGPSNTFSLPQFSGPHPVLFSGSRGSNQFTFQIYAPVTTNYTVERALNLATPTSGTTWQTVRTVSCAASNIVTVADSTASGGSGYYRVRY